MYTVKKIANSRRTVEVYKGTKRIYRLDTFVADTQACIGDVLIDVFAAIERDSINGSWQQVNRVLSVISG